MKEKIGKYEIKEVIGKGGFGVVYKGYDPFIKRFVAIKTCELEDKEVRQRFYQEAQLAGNLQHPNITTIYDFGLEEDVPYIVQEFLTGNDLDILLKQNLPFTFQEKVHIIMEVAKGLHAAHQAGIIHRDIKPGNIRILEDGSVKIMDFGIAKSKSSASKLTQTGTTVGTSSYLAPEQIKGEELDPRTDIFALGVVMYELFTGRKPFTGENITAVIYKILNEHPIPPMQLNPSIPPEMDAIILKALSKKQEDRFSSARELYGALRHFIKRDTSQKLEGFMTRQVEATQKVDVTPMVLKGMGAQKRFSLYLGIFLVVFFLAAATWWYFGKVETEEVNTNPLVVVRNPLQIASPPPLWTEPLPIPEPEKEATKLLQGSLFIQASRPTTVIVDGKHFLQVPPGRSIQLEEGIHRITWKQGMVKQTTHVTIQAGKNTIATSPIKAVGVLRVVHKMGSPYGEVWVDGKSVGKSPITRLQLSIGKHKVEIRRKGYPPQTYAVEIQENKTEIITFDLRSPP